MIIVGALLALIFIALIVINVQLYISRKDKAKSGDIIKVIVDLIHKSIKPIIEFYNKNQKRIKEISIDIMGTLIALLFVVFGLVSLYFQFSFFFPHPILLIFALVPIWFTYIGGHGLLIILKIIKPPGEHRWYHGFPPRKDD